jgi:hypothetical protein
MGHGHDDHGHSSKHGHAAAGGHGHGAADAHGHGHGLGVTGAEADASHGPAEFPPVPDPRVISPAREDFEQPWPGRLLLWPAVWAVVGLLIFVAARSWGRPIGDFDREEHEAEHGAEHDAGHASPEGGHEAAPAGGAEHPAMAEEHGM